jgi:hypothetical protein
MNSSPLISSEHQAALTPFRPEYRTSGVLMHVTSPPSPCGIGDVVPAAFGWVDRLHDAGQRWWQALPLGPTGCGNSPYSCLSAFAGNTTLVSPDLLIEDGLLSPSDCEAGPLVAPALSNRSAPGQSSPRWNFQPASSETCSRGEPVAERWVTKNAAHAPTVRERLKVMFFIATQSTLEGGH